MPSNRLIPDDWYPATVPDNFLQGENTYFDTTYSLRRFFSRCVPGLVLKAGAGVYANCNFAVGEKGRITIGENAIINGVNFHCEESIEIGDRVMIAWDSVVCDTQILPYSIAGRAACLLAAAADPYGKLPFAPPRPVVIENDAWIGFGSVILPGVRIGARSVIGAHSVVTTNIPADVIAAGNPAKVIRALQTQKEK